MPVFVSKWLQLVSNDSAKGIQKICYLGNLIWPTALKRYEVDKVTHKQVLSSGELSRGAIRPQRSTAPFGGLK